MNLRAMVISAMLAMFTLNSQSGYAQKVSPPDNPPAIKDFDGSGKYGDGRGIYGLHVFNSCNQIRRNWGLMKGDKPIYSEAIDFDRDGSIEVQERVDQDGNRKISDKEIEEWFLRNAEFITTADKTKIVKVFIQGLSDRNSVLRGGDYKKKSKHAVYDPFIPAALKILDPEAAQKGLDELFGTARWGHGNHTGYERVWEIQRFGDLAVDACIRHANYRLDIRKTAMRSLDMLDSLSIDITRATDTVVDRILNDRDFYVQILAERVSGGFNKKTSLRLVKDKDPKVRAVAITPLSYSYEDPVIKKYLDDLVDNKQEHDLVRVQAVILSGTTEQRYERTARKMTDYSESPSFRRELGTSGLRSLLFQGGLRYVELEDFDKLMDGLKYAINKQKPGVYTIDVNGQKVRNIYSVHATLEDNMERLEGSYIPARYMERGPNRQNRTEAHGYFERGKDYCDLQKFDKAKSDFMNAIKLDPGIDEQIQKYFNEHKVDNIRLN